MISRLTRIVLALVTAIVFIGQMEAAAQHCARLVEQAAVAANEKAPPCHQAGASEHAADHAAMNHHPAKTKTPDHCKCVATLIGAEIAGATLSIRVAPYSWLLPEPAQFASSTPDPDLRPPRAWT